MIGKVKTKSYWASTRGSAAFREALGKLHAMVPLSGPCPDHSPALEKFRVASNAYYDIFNNGAGNRHEDVCRIFGLSRKAIGWANCETLYAVTEQIMDGIVVAAMIEQEVLPRSCGGRNAAS